ncbi:hypothetical protein EJB05_01597, partial [Eragrostis curvula]
MADGSGDPPPTLCPLCGHPTAQAAPTTASSPSWPSPPQVLLSSAHHQAMLPLMSSRSSRAPPEAPPAVVRVEIGDEAAALREALARHQAALADVQAELDAERGAAAGAASEAMTMILRLQREKAEAMMEARQFRRYAEEKMAHDAAELAALEEALAKRDAAAAQQQQQQRETPRRQAHHRHPSGASTPRRGAAFCATPRAPASPSPAAGGGYYPALRCCIDHPPTSSEADALDAAQATPRDQLTRLAHRVHLLERGATPVAATTTPIIRVAPGSAFPRAYSDDDGSSLDFRDDGRAFFQDDEDDCCVDRVYTVDDAVRGGGAPPDAGSWYGGSTPVGGGSDCGGRWQAAEDGEARRRLSSRLLSLEADRESMRQAIIDMGADKAQVTLLREIAQKLCNEAAAAPPVPGAVPVAQLQHSYYKSGNVQPAMTVTLRPPRQAPVIMQRAVVVKKQPLRGTSFLAAVLKWVTSIIWWRKKSSRIKYPIGQCGNNVGLLLLLEKAPRAGHGYRRLPKKI